MAKPHELEDIRSQIDQEINSDAPVLSKELFGDHMPDMGKASDAEGAALLREKFLQGDREWLQGEARRDPAQFLRLTNQLGVVMPS